MMHRVSSHRMIVAGVMLGVFALFGIRPPTALAQVKAEETARRLKPAAGLEATLWASEPLLVNPTNIDVDSRGRVWVAEGLNYRLTRGGNKRFHRIEEADKIKILEDTDGDGKADKVDRLRRPRSSPCPWASPSKSTYDKAGKYQGLPRLRRQQPRPAGARRHRRRRQGRQALPALDRVRRHRLRPRRARHGAGPGRQALLHPRRRLLLGPARSLRAAAELRRGRQERPARLDRPTGQYAAGQPRRHAVRDHLRPPAQQLRDQPELVRQHLHQRQRRRRQPRLPGDLGDGRRPLRLSHAGEPAALGRGGAGQRPQAGRHRQRQPVRHHGL